MPDVRYVESAEVPFVWCVGRRPTIVLPMPLLSQLDDRQAAMILAHELAHLRRRDHWVRIVELVVSSVYWWNPLVRVVRRQIHHNEDLCCDAWVCWALPDCSRQYAEVILQTAESLDASAVGPRLLPASPFLHSLSLKARIEMILDSHFAPYVSKRSIVVIALLALLVLPSFVESTKTAARADSNNEAAATPAGKSDQAVTPADKPETQPPSQFPHVVKFEQGATRFEQGDTITILEVRGTSDTFVRGNIYCVKGTYTLGSRDRAVLFASTTVTNAGARGPRASTSRRCGPTTSPRAWAEIRAASPGQNSKFSEPTSPAAPAPSRSFCLLLTRASRTSASVRLKKEERVSAETISERANPC